MHQGKNNFTFFEVNDELISKNVEANLDRTGSYQALVFRRLERAAHGVPEVAWRKGNLQGLWSL